MKRIFVFLVLLSSLLVLACPANVQFTRPDSWADIRQFGYPTSGSVNILVCNPTSGPLTPGVATVNWKLVHDLH